MTVTTTRLGQAAGIATAVGGAIFVAVQVNHPARRHQITAAPFVTLQIGTHVDINASFSVSQRIFPKPDESVIDPSDYAQLSRLSYAEPLAITASLGLSFHWDPTNGVRNDRIESI